MKTGQECNYSEKYVPADGYGRYTLAETLGESFRNLKKEEGLKTERRKGKSGEVRLLTE
jgi:hypothetical protein